MKTMLSSLCCCCDSHEHEEKRALITRHSLKMKRWKIYNYEELYAATNGFHEENKIGEGWFGTVYYGKTTNGDEIAVRKLTYMNCHTLMQFGMDVEISGRIRHKNSLGLRGFCPKADYPLIAYDFMPKLCLHSHLHGQFSHEAQLDWGRRMKIAIGVAQGLRYFHEDANPSIIHTSIKASNILLDSNFEPVISDFRFARLIPEDEIRSYTVNVKGTLGYLAPEYAMLGQVSESSDVYSYGCLLLELLSGRQPSHRFSSNGELRRRTIIDWAKPLISEGRFDELVDTKLGGEYDEHQLKKVANVALLCVKKEHRKRPVMKEVVILLRESDVERRRRSAMKIENESDDGDLYEKESDEEWGTTKERLFENVKLLLERFHKS